MAKTIKLTDEGLKKLQDELDNLKNVRRKENTAALKVAKSFGDLSENEEYSSARNEQKMAESRILEIQDILKNAKIIRAGKKDKVALGATVSIRLSGKKMEYTLVGPTEANPLEGKISNESPIGKLLMGHKADEELDFNGKKLVILEIK